MTMSKIPCVRLPSVIEMTAMVHNAVCCREPTFLKRFQINGFLPFVLLKLIFFMIGPGRQTSLSLLDQCNDQEGKGNFTFHQCIFQCLS